MVIHSVYHVIWGS